MKLGLVGIFFLFATFALPGFLCATDDHHYKPGETLVIDHGLSLDKQFSIAAGNTFKGGEETFHLFLVDAKTRKRIGPLEEVDSPLDTGPESLHAAWAPDSRHVILTYRIDRHEIQMLIYRIEDRRAYLVEGPPDLIEMAKAGKVLDTANRNSFSLEAKWMSATRFGLNESSQYQHVTPDPGPVLGPYLEDLDAEADDEGKKQYSFDFEAAGICELLPGDKSRVVAVKPAKR